MPRKEEIERLIKSHQRRLQKLEEQHALYGASIDPRILIEIEDIGQEIKTLQEGLETLENDDGLSSLPLPKPITSVFLSYDWEDRPDVRHLVNDLRSHGVKIAWDQDWPHWHDFDKELEQAISNADIIVLYSTSHSQHSEWVRKEIEAVEQAKKQIIVLDIEPNVRFDLAIDKVGVDLTNSRQAQMVEIIMHELNPKTEEFIFIGKQKNGADVGELLDKALEANLGIPSDMITDRFFASPVACQLVEQAYGIAKNTLDAEEPQRLRASLEYGRLRRFQGEWEEADKVLRQGRGFAKLAKSELYPDFCLESGALQFEMGQVNGKEWVDVALNEFQMRGITVSLIKTLRQLGNILREQGEWDQAERYLTAAMFIAEYFQGENTGTEPTYRSARYLLWIDCIRERAALLSQQGNADEAIKQFEAGLNAAEKHTILPATHSEHIRGIILYQLGRVYLLHKHDINTALDYLEKSVQILHKYDNPIRLSFLYDALGKTLTQQRPLTDFDKAERYLKKAKRVRDRCGHEYFSAYTLLGIGDLYRAKGAIKLAIEQYEGARDTFIRLGKTRDLGMALFELGTSYAQHNEYQKALESLQSAEKQFRRVKLEGKVRDVKFELLKLQHSGDELKTLLDQLALHEFVEIGKDKNYDFVLNEIGEYKFHSWIKKMAEDKIPDVPLFGTRLRRLIDIGIGDDAGVIGIPGSDMYELVLTTDAAPGSICRSPEAIMGRYAAKFSVVHSISDILAMGGTPMAVLLNLYLARGATLEYAMAVIETVINEASKYNAALIGGDLKERNEQSIGCVGIGVVEKGKAIRRSGARPGHVVAITLAGMPDEPGVIRKIGCRWAQEIIEYRELAKTKPYSKLYSKNWKRDLLFLAHKGMIAGARTGLIRSAIDTSDGFLSCLELLGRESKVGFVLEETLIEEIIDDRVKEIAKALELKPAQFLFNAGHDWEIVLTVQEDDFYPLQDVFIKAGGNLARLGTVCNITDLIDPTEIDTQSKKPLETGTALISSETGKKLWIPFFTDEKFVRRAYEERPTDWEDLRFYLEGRRELE